MQYFTFIGTNNYDEIAYVFKGEQKIYPTKYIQEAIVSKYNKEIQDVYIFCTEQSKEANGLSAKAILEERYQKKVYFFITDEAISAEFIISKMKDVLKEDFIFDVTHCFRNIPIVTTLITNYLESATGFELKHLYYGNYQTKLVMDLIAEYKHSKLAKELDMFEKTLKASPESLQQYKDDRKVVPLLDSFNDLNHMLEYCEFNKSIKCLQQVVVNSKRLLEKEDGYILLEPYLQRIIAKFELFDTDQPLVMKKTQLIRLLLSHQLFQIAITFTDQLLREELVHYYYFPTVEDFNGEKKYLKKLRNDKYYPTLYKLSQDLFYYLKVRKNGEESKSDTRIVEIREKNKNLQRDPVKQSILMLNRQTIDNFYNNVRNVVNHGATIEEKTDVKKIITELLVLIEKFVAKE